MDPSKIAPRPVRTDGAGSTPADPLVICNPASGSEDHLDQIRGQTTGRGWELRVTDGEGDARRYAREATRDGATLVAAAGGDGTVNEVVNGFVDADVETWPTLLIVPAGTGNNAASNLGIESIDEAFALAETGERRGLDIGMANDRAFFNSCIGGLTANASLEADGTSKRRLGVLAYVVQTIETARTYEGPPLRATLENATAETPVIWEGEVVLVFVGNCRRFTSTRRAQAHAEDGLLEVTLVEDASIPSIVGSAALEQLFDREPDGIVRHRVPTATIENLDSGSITYSLDGELLEAERLRLETIPSAISVVVGAGYQANPDADSTGQ